MAHPIAPVAEDSVIAVVVSFNRRDLLVDVLNALAAQTRPVDGVLVIDNHSSDGAAAVARQHASGPSVVELTDNIGGAGGFTAGLAYAISQHQAELVWLMDDDTVPEPEALEALMVARDAAQTPVAVLASRVLWTDGRDHPMNTPRRRFAAPHGHSAAADRAGAIPIRSSSFVSMLVDARAVRASGLPVADYFLWNDDFEFSARLLRRRIGLWVAASRVEHRTAKFGDTDTDPGDRFFYEVRNKLWLFTRSHALSPWEYPLFGVATLRRWLRTFRKSPERPRLARAAAKGLKAAMTSKPRSNRAVLGPVLPGHSVRSISERAN